jgi:hypothetical protein
MLKFVPSSKTLNRPRTQRISLKQIFSLALNHVFPGQRNHGKNIARRRHVHGELTDDSLVFIAAYSLADQCLWFMDGYHRATALMAEFAWLPANAQPLLTVHTVANRTAANRLFEKLNSLAAAKRSGDYFDSALRDAGLLNCITSHLVLRGGRAEAAKYAAGRRGAAQTRQATLDVIKGIEFVDSLNLSKRRGELAGVLAVYFAIAQHAKDTDLAETFIRNVNAEVFSPAKLKRGDKDILVYRNSIAKLTSRTGRAANTAMFELGLAGFIRYANSVTGKSLAVPQSLSLGEFLQYVKKVA